jgi:hypothetical protein
MAFRWCASGSNDTPVLLVSLPRRATLVVLGFMVGDAHPTTHYNFPRSELKIRFPAVRPLNERQGEPALLGFAAAEAP